MGLKTNTEKFNPFPGLRPFTPDESDLFFGREGQSSEVLNKLLKNRFVTVIGASGSGKSSLIYCGVLPKIQKVKTNEKTTWKIVAFRPGNDPLTNLTEALFEKKSSAEKGALSKSDISETLRSNTDGLTVVISKILTSADDKMLLVIDQFEELFRYKRIGTGGVPDENSAGFINLIVNAVGQSSGSIYIIVTMRSDFIGECAHFQGFTQLINDSNYLVPHMSRSDYKEAIEGPVKYAGAKIDTALIETLLEDIGEKTDQLPVLQHALMRTWTHWQELDDPDRLLGYSDYDSVGKMSDAMSRHANEAYEELSVRGREICEIMFKTITEKGSDNKGVRHPSSIKTIAKVALCSNEELFDVIEKFRITSRSFITPRQNIPLDADSIIDLSHESIMRLWDRLREWVDEEAASVQMYLRLSEASAMYQQGKTSLWRPPDLQLAINWREENKPTLTWAERYNPAFERAMVYLKTSEKEYLAEEENKIKLQKKQLRRSKIVAMILGTASIISVGFMLFAFVKKIDADNQRLEAEKQRNEASVQRTLAVDNATLANQNAEQARIEKENADSQRVIAVTNEQEATKQRRIADENAVIATEQRNLAVTNEKKALTNEQLAREQEAIAKTEKDNALRLRMVSIGKTMSIKSLQIQGQKDLQTLLAYQAYLFNKNNKGISNDADIYSGLYNVAKQYGSDFYKIFKGHSGKINSIAFVPGTREFFTSGSDGKVLKWNLDNKDQSFQVIYTGLNDRIEVIAVSPDGGWLACGSDNSMIRMIPLKANQIGFELRGHTDMIKSLIFSIDGLYLYSAALDGKVLKWDIGAKTYSNVNTGSFQIKYIDLSSDGKQLAGISTSGSVLVWNPEQLTGSSRIETTLKDIKVVRFKPDENILALGDVNGNIELWDLVKKAKVSETKGHTAMINDIQFNNVNSQMATVGNDKTIKIWNAVDLNQPPVNITDNDGFVVAIEFSPDGKALLSGTYQGENNLVSRPSHVDNMVANICSLVTRNFTQEEWDLYVAPDIPIEQTCTNKSYKIQVNVVKQTSTINENVQ
jgi:energy-coupling factor transporter ATP-binding protein EcfA2